MKHAVIVAGGVAGMLYGGVAPALAQDADERMIVHVLRPSKVDATQERIDALEVPEGFRIQKVAEDLGNSRFMAIGPDGSLYVTRRREGDVLRLRDSNRDGRFDQRQTVARLEGAHGITIRGNEFYLANSTQLLRAEIRPDGSLGELELLLGDLPDGGQHPNRTMAFGPDGQLYFSVGSSCNACEEPNPEHATMLVIDPQTWSRTVYARGLRNTIGFGWHPETGDFWGMDHGTDWLGDDVDEEDLVHIQRGHHYGWPYIFDDGKPNPVRQPPGMTHEEFAKQVTNPVLTYTAHAAPMGMAFYTGDQFPPEYRNDAFVAMRGSWNRKPPSGYEIVHIRFDDRGRPQEIRSWISGFLLENETEHFARLCGIVVDRDGSLLISDDDNGVIYRVSYVGQN